jgi:hypothetical protein
MIRKKGTIDVGGTINVKDAIFPELIPSAAQNFDL